MRLLFISKKKLNSFPFFCFFQAVLYFGEEPNTEPSAFFAIFKRFGEMVEVGLSSFSGVRACVCLFVFITSLLSQNAVKDLEKVQKALEAKAAAAAVSAIGCRRSVGDAAQSIRNIFSSFFFFSFFFFFPLSSFFFILPSFSFAFIFI